MRHISPRVRGAVRLSLRTAPVPTLAALAAVIALGALSALSCGGVKGSGFADPDAGGSASGGLGSGSSGTGGFQFDSGLVSPSSEGGTAPSAPIAINGCPGTLSASNTSSLQAGGAVPATMKWLYPYDQTVFPGGILAPILQWAQAGSPDGVYVHLHSNRFDYKGCFAGSTPPQLALPQMVWDTAWAQGDGINDPLTVEVTTTTGGTVTGPIRESWTLARGSLKGIVYYNTYTSQIAAQAQNAGNNNNNNNGAVMSLAPGASKPTALITLAGVSPVGPCISCHSVSANGQYFGRPTPLLSLRWYQCLRPRRQRVLRPIHNAEPQRATREDPQRRLGLQRDVSRRLAIAHRRAVRPTSPPFPAGIGNNPGMIGPAPSKMHNPQTGAVMNFRAYRPSTR